MKITIEIQGRKTLVNYNGKETEHNTVFLKKLTVNDFINYITEKYKSLNK